MSNYLFDLKIKELNALNEKYFIKDDMLVIYYKDSPVLLGCKYCYMIKAEITNNGYKIPVGDLVNYYEKFKEAITCPEEIARNCWLCPHCMRLFKELIPEFDFLEVKNVSI